MAARQELNTEVEHRMCLTRLLEVREDVQAKLNGKHDDLGFIHIEALRVLEEANQAIALYHRGGTVPFDLGPLITVVWLETTLHDVVVNAHTNLRPKWRQSIRPI